MAEAEIKKGERVGGEVREMGRGRPCGACKPLQRLAFPLRAEKQRLCGRWKNKPCVTQGFCYTQLPANPNETAPASMMAVLSRVSSLRLTACLLAPLVPALFYNKLCSPPNSC